MSLAGFAAIAGVFVRFWDLGSAPLAIDEYYIGTSILNIVERGLPEFACGGIYPRGLITQYLTVPLLHLGASLEFSVRFWPAIASVLTIVGVWHIGNLAGGRLVGSIAVILTSLSLWEIEFGRFGRMYAPYQAMFVWYAYFQIQHLVGGREGARWAYLGISALSIVEFSGAVFLLIFNFLPLVWRDKKWTPLHLTVASVVLAFGVAFHRTDFRSIGVASDLIPDGTSASDVAAAILLPIQLPILPDNPLPILFCGLAVFCSAIFRFRQQIFIRHPAAIFWLLATICLSFGLLGAGAALIVAGIFLNLPLPALEKRLGVRDWLTYLFLLVFGWAVVLLANFHLGGADFGYSVRSSVKYMFDYPNVYRWILRPWLDAIPATTATMSILILPVVWRVFRSSDDRGKKSTATLGYLLATVILSSLLVASLWQPSPQTRYSFFLYPLIIVMASAGIAAVATSVRLQDRARILVPLAAIGILFLGTEDYSVRHMANINEPEYRFRTAYDFEQGMHYYFRWDFRGVAEYVNSHLGTGDSVITFADVVPHYLDRTDGVFFRADSPNHGNVSACNGTLHVWSNAPLLDRDVDVQQLIEETKGQVWMIMRRPADAYHDPLESSLVEAYALQPQFTSQDGNLIVYKIDPRDLGSQQQRVGRLTSTQSETVF